MKIVKSFRAILICLILFSSLSQAQDKPAQDSAAPSSSSNEYQIGSENSLQIDITYGKGEKISQKVRVSSKGDIACPLVGDVPVKGLTIPQIQQRLMELLAKDYLVNPQVAVYIEEYSTVSIIGEVKKPGSYPIKGRLTVVELISLAEGFTKIAAPNKVKVIRKNPDGTTREIPVRVYDIMNKNTDVNSDVVLEGGDVVMVSESLF